MARQEAPVTFAIDNSEAWRQVAPEEKFEMMNRAHAIGVIAAFICIIVLCTIAVAFKTTSIMWAGIVLSPLIFQYAAGKAWRDLKPRITLEYLAARSAARRFAFAEGAKDLHLQLLFRGSATPVLDRSDIQQALENAAQNVLHTETWVALFNDTVVMMNEHPGGASLVFGHGINERLSLESSDNGGYSNTKELLINAKDRAGVESKFKLNGPYPGALAVFEKRVLQLQSEFKKLNDRRDEIASITADAVEEQNEFQTF